MGDASSSKNQPKNRSKNNSKKFDLWEITRSLRAEKLWNDRSLDVIGSKADYRGSARGKPPTYAFPKPSECLDEPSELAVFLFRAATDPAFLGFVWKHPAAPIETSGSSFGGGTWDLKHSHLSDLFLRGHFGRKDTWKKSLVERDFRMLETVAYLTLKGVTREWACEQIFPFLTFSRFKAIQSKVFAEVEKTLPETSRRFLAASKGFTALQHEAIEKFYLENSDRKSKREIAKSLGISTKSFNERLDGALQRIEREFQELTPSKKSLPLYWKTLFREPDRRLDGMLFQKKTEETGRLYRVDPVSSARFEVPVRTGKLKRLPVTAEILKHRERERVTTYVPNHDGVMSPKYAHLPNVYPWTVKAGLLREKKVFNEVISGDPKAAYHAFSRESGRSGEMNDEAGVNSK